MKKNILLFCFLFIAMTSFSQNDTTKIYNSNQLKKGFYKTYEEYLNNNPSLQPGFTAIPVIKSKTDTTLIAARYKMDDISVSLPAVWGFCDGTDVFIAVHTSLFKKHFLKAEYIGRNPFFLKWYGNDYTNSQPLSTIPAGTPLPASQTVYVLMFINNKGKVKMASYSNLKKLFAEDYDILKRFSTERSFPNKVKTEYLVQFNERFISEK